MGIQSPQLLVDLIETQFDAVGFSWFLFLVTQKLSQSALCDAFLSRILGVQEEGN